jgi:hypothetical protein
VHQAQILLAGAQYQDKYHDQNQPAEPNPTIIPTLHPHAVSVH